jgi:uncharacterized membrane protein
MISNNLTTEAQKNSRRFELDLLKALAIISMIICHPVSRLGIHNPGYENNFFFIHWCILGFVDSIVCYLFDIVFSWPVIYLIGAVLIVVSAWIANLWAKRKRFAKAQ